MKKIERDDWFATGLEILKKDGFLKITIDNLCDALKVTKGSFYHHFKNADAYIDAFMKYWVEKNTGSLITQIDKVKPPHEKIEKLNRLVLQRSHKSEQVIRGWSFSNEVVRKYVAEVDETRIEYTANLKILCGEQADVARHLAMLEYACLIGIQQLHPDMSEKNQLELYKLFCDRIQEK